MTAGTGLSLAGIVAVIVSIVNSYVIPLLYALAFLFFVAGVARYTILGAGNEESREKAKQMMLYGIIGLVVLFGVWGLVNLLLGTLTSVTGVSAT